jgi:hypothetical protein
VICIHLFLKNDSFNHVSIFVRKSPNISHEKLSINTINFSKISEYKSLVNGDVLFSALGTTKKDAGRSEKQFLVDFTYQYKFAEMAYENGVTTYSLVSSDGANKDSFFFYPKIKGALEEEVKSLGFNKIHIFQPPSLIRQPELIRLGEKYTINLLQVINKIGFLRSLKPLFVKDLAKKIINESLTNKIKGLTVYKSKDLFN